MDLLVLFGIMVGMVVGSLISDFTWYMRLKRAQKALQDGSVQRRTLHAQDEGTTACEVERMPDGMIYLYTKSGSFLAQGTSVEGLTSVLRSRFGSGKEYVFDGTIIRT